MSSMELESRLWGSYKKIHDQNIKYFTLSFCNCDFDLVSNYCTMGSTYFVKPGPIRMGLDWIGPYYFGTIDNFIEN